MSLAAAVQFAFWDLAEDDTVRREAMGNRPFNRNQLIINTYNLSLSGQGISFSEKYTMRVMLASKQDREIRTTVISKNVVI